MKRFGLPAIAIVSFTLGAALVYLGRDPQRVEPKNDAAWIFGKVQSGDGVGLRGAQIRVESAAGATSTESCEAGAFSVPRPKGPFTISANYAGKSLGQQKGAGGQTPIYFGFENEKFIGKAGAKISELEELVRARDRQLAAATRDLRAQRADASRARADATRAKVEAERVKAVARRATAAAVAAAQATRPPVTATPPPPAPPFPPAPVVETAASPAPPDAAPAATAGSTVAESAAGGAAAAAEGAVPFGDGPCSPDAPCHIRVYYGTDRKVVEDLKAIPGPYKRLGRVFGGDRQYGDLAYGECLVRIPKSYKRHSGEIGKVTAASYARGETVELESIEPRDQETWLRNLSARVKRGDGEMIVFVHGFNVSFQDAARRTAQMHYDLELPGAPVFFSWPSRTGILRYWADEASIEWSAPNLKKFLDVLSRQTGAKKIHLIAHSMGSRALTRALSEIGEQNRAALENGCGGDVAKFSQIFLAAPDLDLELFKQLHAAVRDSADRVTIYASNRDRTMRVSRLLHFYPRLGERQKQFDVTGVTAIDATSASTDWLGHSYYGKSILWDVRATLENPGAEASTRCTLESSTKNGYLRFKPRRAPVPLVKRMFYWLNGRREQYRDELESPCPGFMETPMPAPNAP